MSARRFPSGLFGSISPDIPEMDGTMESATVGKTTDWSLAKGEPVSQKVRFSKKCRFSPLMTETEIVSSASSFFFSP
ncbi:MAG: hypothetical protein BWY86_01384 [Candidatus Aminicenantes bacterium ADurb.Bin508]|nr:MAG: hypothetical protein BWY86_01384 [Candidatus Aminicenantes bacterium ADurb.Bin508]